MMAFQKIFVTLSPQIINRNGNHERYQANCTHRRTVRRKDQCAGAVIEHFSSLGYKVFTIPEVPTMYTQAGMDYLTQNKDFFYEGEKATLEIQMAFEDKFLKMAKACTEPAVIICDRGTMDISAYMKPEMWEEITRAAGTSTHELRDTRYDAILHLVSVADGAEQYYTTNNNASRNEPADEQGLQIARISTRRSSKHGRDTHTTASSTTKRTSTAN